MTVYFSISGKVLEDKDRLIKNAEGYESSSAHCLRTDGVSIKPYEFAFFHDLTSESTSTTSVGAKNMDAGTRLVALFNLSMDSCREPAVDKCKGCVRKSLLSLS